MAKVRHNKTMSTKGLNKGLNTPAGSTGIVSKNFKSLQILHLQALFFEPIG